MFLKTIYIILLSICVYTKSALADDKKALLKINGKEIDILGANTCQDNSTKVEVILPDAAFKVDTDFKAFFINVSNNQGNDGGCDSNLRDLNRLKIDLDKSNNKIELNKFLTSIQCSKDTPAGNRSLCIYNSTGDTLVAYSSFAYDPGKHHKSDGVDITNIVAVNESITFVIDFKGEDSNDIKEYIACYGQASDGDIDQQDDCPFIKKTFAKKNITLSGLTNDTSYNIKAGVLTKNNKTIWSSSFSETPVAAAFALNAYNGKGGDFMFSCTQNQTNNSISFWLIFLALLYYIYFKKTSILSKCKDILLSISYFNLLILSMTIYEKPLFSEPGQLSVGILGSMYRPDLDNEVVDGKTIFPFYQCLFKRKPSDQKGPINPLIGMEFDWTLWDDLGSLKLGLGTSYTFKTGRALGLDSNNNPDCSKPIDKLKISLHMYQLRPQLTYMLGPFGRFPFIPYARGALIGHGYMFFHGTKPENNVFVGNTHLKPFGFRFGYQAALGMMIMLDFLEPSAVNQARGEGLFNHVYLKAELAYTKIDSFGRAGFNFSAQDIMGTKYPLLWTFGLVFDLL